VGVVMAAGGYPDRYEVGRSISGLDNQLPPGTKVFHGGTKPEGSAVLTSGGRVLCVTALGNSVSEAQALAYRAIEGIHWQDCYYRRDIGYRAIARERAA
jgi:phosphoribosylamine--glycine ligase